MNKKKLLIKIISALSIITIIRFNSSSNVEAKSGDRIYGKDRIETCINISRAGWKSGSDVVVIAQGYNYADALSSVPLAKKYNAPILLTESLKLRNSTIDELKRLNAKRVIIIGGPKVISKDTEKQLEAIKINNVKRIYGANRYETSLKIAENVGIDKKVFLTSDNGYADSLSVASIAAKKGVPILFSQKNTLNTDINNFIKNRDIEKIYVIGGQGVISDNVIKNFKNAERIYGKDRFETNKNIIEKFNDSINFEQVYIVQGAGSSNNEFADALSCSALAAKNSAPIILTYKHINKDLKSSIKRNLTSLSTIIPIGGESVVPTNILDELQVNNIENINIDKENTIFGNEETTKNVNGDLSINANNITIKNINVKGVLTVNPGEKGSTDIENMVANTVVIKSGAENSIHIKRSRIHNLIVNSNSNVKIDLDHHSSINNTYIRSSAILNNINGDFGNVIIQDNNNSMIKLIGNFDDIVEVNSKSNLELQGEFIKLRLSNDSKIDIEKGSKVNDINANGRCNINIKQGAIVNNINKLSDYVEINNNIHEITKDQIKTSSGGSSSTSKTNTINSGQFKIIVCENDKKRLILDRNFKIDKHKNILDYLKGTLEVTKENKTGIITSIEGLLKKDIFQLTKEQRERDILGADWFIYINGIKSKAKIQDIDIQEKDIIKLDYHEWDWHEINPSELNMPIKVKELPTKFKSHEPFKVKVVCYDNPIYNATVKIDGKEIAKTDLNGYATINVGQLGKHDLCAEKGNASYKCIIEVESSVEDSPNKPTEDQTEPKDQVTDQNKPDNPTVDPKLKQFKIMISKNNTNEIMFDKNFDIDKDKNVLDHLKDCGQAIQASGSGFISGINGVCSKNISQLTEEQRRRDVLGMDWFIYVNGIKSCVGIKDIDIKETDIIKLDYHEWDWHEFMPGETNMPMKIKEIPLNIKVNETFKLKALCGYNPIYNAIVKIDGHEIATTDLAGYANIVITSQGDHVISIEKNGSKEEVNIKVNGKNLSDSQEGSSSSSLPQETTSSLIKVLGDAPLEVIENNDNKINIKVCTDKYSNKEITIVLFDSGNNLKYLGQNTLHNGQIQFNTKLVKGIYHGIYRIDGLGKIEIPKFQVR